MTTPAIPTRPVVNVSQNQIDEAVRADSSHCMIADALRTSYPSALYISVDTRTIRATDPINGMRMTWLTPIACARNIVRWDQGINPEPFRVQLSSPIQMRPAGRAGRGRTRVTAVKQNKGDRGSPTIIGGAPLPRAALSSGPTSTRSTSRGEARRAAAGRQFGIRALGTLNP
jgi:hypothetical protein